MPTVISSMVHALPSKIMDVDDDTFSRLEARQSSSPGGNSSKTTIIFASVIGTVLGLFVLVTVTNILRSKFDMRMPSIPMPELPPSYLSILRLGRRNPEDVGPPLPVYMERPDGSTTVLQRSESRRTRAEDALPRSSESDHPPSQQLLSPNSAPVTEPVTEPPPYMKEPELMGPDSPSATHLPEHPPSFQSSEPRTQEVHRTRSS